ncbi:MAG: DUF4956 domain-containing protein, partial [Saccharofermentans sp.]|nr:DUF4956 domain-containing protein [Saccharofermentans sp.]
MLDLTNLTLTGFIICLAVALVLGTVIALSYMFKNKTSKTFAATLILLPAVVCCVILMVNGSVGTGVAVAGTFSLVRFRSAPGSAKEIAAVFLSMAAGLICGMGYFVYAAVFTVILCLALILLTSIGLGEKEDEKEIRITIPESLDYEGVFDEIMAKHTSSHKLVSVKTTDMGSLFRLNYVVVMKKGAGQKAFIDELRIKNGNLPISIHTSGFGEQQ